MPKFVYSPRVIDACRFTATGDNGKPGFENPEDWVTEALSNQSSPAGHVSLHYTNNPGAAIFRTDSVNGVLEGKIGDWLVREAEGRFIVREDSQIRANYTEISEATAEQINATATQGAGDDGNTVDESGESETTDPSA